MQLTKDFVEPNHRQAKVAKEDPKFAPAAASDATFGHRPQPGRPCRAAGIPVNAVVARRPWRARGARVHQQCISDPYGRARRPAERLAHRHALQQNLYPTLAAILAFNRASTRQNVPRVPAFTGRSSTRFPVS